jgi:outer membrane beta-barrel protein
MLKLICAVLALSFLIPSATRAGEKSLYDFLWLDPDKKVYVLQNKLYKKEHSLYVDIGYVSNVTSKFQDTNGFQLRTGFYLHEEWALELATNQYTNSNNDELRNLRAVTPVDPFIRRFRSSYGANVIWSPFYGKINTFNQIFYFDWSFGAGLAHINAESNLRTSRQGASAITQFDRETHTGAVLKSNLKFHVRENIHLGIEYMNTYYRAPSPANPNSKKLRTNSDLILSIGFSY